MDRFTHQLFEFLQAAQPETTLQQLIDHFDPSFLGSTTVIRSDLFSKPASQVLLSEFFSSRRDGQKIGKYPIEGLSNFEFIQKAAVATDEYQSWTRKSFTFGPAGPASSTMWLLTISLITLFWLASASSKSDKKVRK